MKPSQIAKSLGCKSMSEVARAYGVHDAHLVRVNEIDPDRFIRMVKVHVLARDMLVSTKHLEFMLEHVAGNIKNTYSEKHFTGCVETQKELTHFHSLDFKVRVRDMYQKVLDDKNVQAEFGDLVLGLVGGKE